VAGAFWNPSILDPCEQRIDLAMVDGEFLDDLPALPRENCLFSVATT
jgi:hypothetical protein